MKMTTKTKNEDGEEMEGGSQEVKQYRSLHSITIDGTSSQCSAPPLLQFADTPFGSTILGEVQRAGFSAPTPIQAESWPIALQGHDMVSRPRVQYSNDIPLRRRE
jgi:ATP-dependent RNA helicase DDX5/DBP2